MSTILETAIELLEICRTKCSPSDEIILSSGRTNHQALLDAVAVIESETLPIATILPDGRLACPECGRTEWLRYIEDIQNCRQVDGVEEGELRIFGAYETGEGFDDGQNGRLLCDGDCCIEFAIPEGMTIDWIN